MGRTSFTEAELRFLSRTRVARLATSDTSGQPQVIPIVFASDGTRLYSPLDDKPKRVGPRELKRARNIVANPQVAIVVDKYDEDWARLAWVLITGTAEILDSGENHIRGVYLLREKYAQHYDDSLVRRSIIAVTPTRVASWGALGE